ncbi:4-carboxymuconolactone decarboxylase [Ruegeria sp.]|uniref:4-carboxymuconolactone decarboxylase n=1 Tax=Ruegeria sp. TaxID=1879320 RepID=UPI00231FE401|nr:4-carboxymuconolactone decarboxylase [Ruegeria sp.]MDA7965558.1 4-carboxymuconolactone decarboxylase [Ruegeria sp.]
MTEKSERYRQGMETRRQVLGDAFVAAAPVSEGALNGPFLEMATEASWGHVWSRPHWSHRERSMVTIAILAALGHHEELALHIRSTVNTGCSREDIQEALMHCAIYAGVPAANGAFKVAKAVLAEMDET